MLEYKNIGNHSPGRKLSAFSSLRAALFAARQSRKSIKALLLDCFASLAMIVRTATNIVAILAIIILAILPEACFADVNVYDATKYLPSTDVSLKLLTNIFGAIPGISQLVANKQTVVSVLFYAFNWGLFGISGIFLCYTTIKLITDMSLEGGQMKGNISSMWTVLRAVCGVGLLIPTSSGYSTANTLIMWVVIQSISLANWTWFNVLNYGFADQVGIGSSTALVGSLFEADKRIVKTIDYSFGENDANVGAADILRSLVCAETIKYALSQVKSIDVESTSNLQTYSCRQKTNIGDQKIAMSTCSFPYIQGLDSQSAKDKPLLDALFPGNTKDRESSFNNFIYNYRADDLNGICGVYSGPATALQQTVGALSPESKRLLNIATSKNPAEINPAQYVLRYDNSMGNITMAVRTQEAKGVEGLSKAADSLYAKNYKRNNKDDYSESEAWRIEQSLKIPQTSIDLLSAAIAYNQNSETQAMTEQTTEKLQKNDNVRKQLNQGWAMAGGYYRDIDKQIEESMAVVASEQIQYDGKNKSDNKLRSRMPNIDTLFVYSDNNSGNDNVALLLRNIDELGSQLDPLPDAKMSDSNSNKYLNSMLTWIYFTVDYAAILKYNLQTQDVGVGSFKFLEHTKGLFGFGDKNSIKGDLDHAMRIASVPIVNLGAYELYAPLPKKIMQVRLGSIVQEWYGIMSNEKYIKVNGRDINAKDPISKLQLLGHVIIENSLAYFKDMKKLLTDMGIAYTISSGISAGVATGLSVGTSFGLTTGAVILAFFTGTISDAVEKMTQAMVNTEMSLGLAVFAPLLVIGATLSVYVPLIPYMVFLFGVISWLISVITLMFAAPMICFLMLWGAASQENPLLSREAESFVNQLIGAFVRPTLMIVGLVVGVVLCNIGIDLLNHGFGLTFDNNLFNTGGENMFGKEAVGQTVTFEDFEKNMVLTIAKNAGGMIIYTFLLVSLVNMTFSAIHVVYTEVMRLVGVQVGAVSGAEAEKAMQDIKQGIEGLTQAGAGGMKEEATGMRGSSNKPQEKDLSKLKHDKGEAGKGKLG